MFKEGKDAGTYHRGNGDYPPEASIRWYHCIFIFRLVRQVIDFLQSHLFLFELFLFWNLLSRHRLNLLLSLDAKIFSSICTGTHLERKRENDAQRDSIRRIFRCIGRLETKHNWQSRELRRKRNADKITSNYIIQWSVSSSINQTRDEEENGETIRRSRIKRKYASALRSSRLAQFIYRSLLTGKTKAGERTSISCLDYQHGIKVIKVTEDKEHVMLFAKFVTVFFHHKPHWYHSFRWEGERAQMESVSFVSMGVFFSLVFYHQNIAFLVTKKGKTECQM